MPSNEKFTWRRCSAPSDKPCCREPSSGNAAMNDLPAASSSRALSRGPARMMEVQLVVNGEPVQGWAEPRTHLADFLREQCALTGTHLGCEHGVCGACTVLIDDKPARSCIAYAVACSGSVIRTVEGFDDDPIMADLRAAFTREHAVQCGFCTPGMLIAARDVVLRCPDADEKKVR